MSKGIVLVNGENNGAIANGDHAVAVAGFSRKECFAEGDTVQVRSGGPLMTVTGIRENVIRCGWFSGKEYSEHEFPSVALRRSAPKWEKQETAEELK